MDFEQVGEAFRKFIGTHAVMLSYVIATAYCASDSIAKGVRAFYSTRQSQAAGSTGEQADTGSCVANAVKAVVDTFMWQVSCIGEDSTHTHTHICS